MSINFGSSEEQQDTDATSTAQQQYDPDRHYMEMLAAYEMYGPEGVTGWDYNYSNPYQTGYDAGPSWDYFNSPEGPPEWAGPGGGLGTGSGDVPVDNSRPGQAGGGPGVGQPMGPPPGGTGNPGGDVPGGGRNTRTLTRPVGPPGPAAPQDRAANAERGAQIRAGRGDTSVAPPRSEGRRDAAAPGSAPVSPAVYEPMSGDSSGDPGARQTRTVRPQQTPTPDGDPGFNNGDGINGWYDQNNVFHPGTKPVEGDTEGSGGPGDQGGGIAPRPRVPGQTGAGGAGSEFLGGLGGFQGQPGKYAYGSVVGPKVKAGHKGSGQPAEYAGQFSRWGEGGASGNKALAGGRAFAGFASTMDNPDVNAATQDYMKQDRMNAVNAKYAGAVGQIDRNASVQGNNNLGRNAALTQLAASQADESGKAIRDVDIFNEAERQKRYEWGAEGVKGMYNDESAFLGNMMGVRSGLSNQPVKSTKNTKGKGNVIAGSIGGGISIM